MAHSNHHQGDTSTKPCCKDETGADKKLVKATDLPLHGNPYPPKDTILVEKPTFLETKVASVRQALQPYVSPIGVAYERTNDFVSVGVAHSQSAMQRLAENQSSVVNALIISGSGLLGIALARRRGIFKKLLYGSVFFTGAFVACFPKEAEEKASMLLYIAKNKLPVVAQQQYEKLTDRTAENVQKTTTEIVVQQEPKN